MSDEPLTMTLEEAKRRYDAASAELDRICQGPRANFRMRIPAQRDDSDLILSDALVALRDMTRTVVVERDDKAELVGALCKLEAAATVLSNHDRIKQPTRRAGDWSRLHNAIDGARAALAAVGEEKA